jgi:hypothetical protein
MELKGKVKVIGETEVVGTSEFKKRMLVVKTDEQYPQMIPIEFVQDKTTLLDKFKVGDAVIIGVNIRGREWTNPDGEAKYFLSLQGWRMVKDGATANTDPLA